MDSPSAGRLLCWLGLHAWRPQTFSWNGGHGSGRECSRRRCDKYELKQETWTRTGDATRTPPKMHWFDALLLRVAPVSVVIGAACIAVGFFLLAVVGAWTIKDAVW